MLDKNNFLKDFSITTEDFEATGLKWSTLEEIYEDYSRLVPILEKKADDFTFKLIDKEGVHSVRRRVKKPSHLIEKIIRKGSKYLEKNINVNNYRDIVTDLIGVRVLHLFKEDWIRIHHQILKNWKVAETPEINVRPGDYNMDTLKKSMKSLKCNVIIREHGYRSVHYLIEKQLDDGSNIYIEMQVRTVFEEAWSEIDHLIRYPYDVDNPILNEYLSIFNRLVGSADEMGTFIKHLKPTVSSNQNEDIEADNKYK